MIGPTMPSAVPFTQPTQERKACMSANCIHVHAFWLSWQAVEQHLTACVHRHHICLHHVCPTSFQHQFSSIWLGTSTKLHAITMLWKHAKHILGSSLWKMWPEEWRRGQRKVSTQRMRKEDCSAPIVEEGDDNVVVHQCRLVRC
jgi:hypothetical protein